ncbi:hypothetical protein SCACP_38880 [Sporomusa carbonis]|uniref:hypothetical protein n=1 Tax=Sporomusa carbonis TaxID=3076075 RepID=UPI003A720D32
MNVDNGHLIKLAQYEAMRAGYQPVPPELQTEAERELAGKNESFVDLKAASPLANWAAKKRAERDKKNDKRRMAKESRRRNRA